MKLQYKIPAVLALLGGMVLITTGCLKDKLQDDGLTVPEANNSPMVIEIPGTLPAVESYNSTSVVSMSPGDKDTTINFVFVRLAADGPASEDIKVQLEFVPDLVEAFNDSTDRHAVPIPSNLYKLDPVDMIVTIPKGSRDGILKMTVKPSDIDDGEYAFGLRIKSVQNSGYTISGNFKHSVVSVGVRNKYDGQYNYRQKTIGWTAYGVADNDPHTWPTNVNIVTNGMNTVTLNTREAGDAFVAFDPDGGLLGFGATQVQYQFDLATNKVSSVKNLAPPDTRNRTFVLNPAVTDSRYDPATKTIYAAYLFKQNGRPDMEVYDTLVYRGTR